MAGNLNTIISAATGRTHTGVPLPSQHLDNHQNPTASIIIIMCLYFQIQNLQMNVIASASIEIKLKNIEESV